MAEKYTRWYRTGTIDVTNNSKYITGTSCYWLATTIQAGDLFTADNGQSFYEIDEVVDSSHITLKTVYTGETKTGIQYAICRNFTASDSSKIAAVTAELMQDFIQYIDNDMQTIHGQSAYEIAVKEGYSGTESEWLESLKAAGEWTKASESISTLEADNTTNKETLASHTESITEFDDKVYSIFVNRGVNSYQSVLRAGLHNSIARGKALGTMTDAMWKSINNATYDDMYIGDKITFNGNMYVIAAFGWRNHYGSASTDSGDVVLLAAHQDLNKPFNKSNTTEGGFASSAFYNDEDGGYAWIKNAVLSDIPEEHILSTEVASTGSSGNNQGTWAFQISTGVDENGAITGVKALPGLQIMIPTIENVTGNQGISGGYKCDNVAWSRTKQLPYFRYSSQRGFSLHGNQYNRTFFDSFYAPDHNRLAACNTNSSTYAVQPNSNLGAMWMICVV